MVETRSHQRPRGHPTRSEGGAGQTMVAGHQPGFPIRGALSLTARDRLLRTARDLGVRPGGEGSLENDWTMRSLAGELEGRIGRAVLRWSGRPIDALAPWRLLVLPVAGARGIGFDGTRPLVCHVLLAGPAPAWRHPEGLIERHALASGDAAIVSAGPGSELVRGPGETMVLESRVTLR